MTDNDIPRQVRVVETSDRYLVLDSVTGLEVDRDGVGFSDEEAAIRWAKDQGFEILN
jgi:hypothetical protein